MLHNNVIVTQTPEILAIGPDSHPVDINRDFLNFSIWIQN